MTLFSIGAAIIVKQSFLGGGFNLEAALFGLAVATSPATLRLDEWLRTWRGGS